MKRVFVIGAGIGGLAAAIRLAVNGYAVKVFEKNTEPGGKLFYVEQDGYAFDGGPSLFTQPYLIEELFELAGETMQAYLEYISLPVSCKYFFDDGTTVDAYTKKELFANELELKLGEDPGSIIEYLDRAGKSYHTIGQIFLDHSLHQSSTWLSRKLFSAIGATKLSYLTKSLHNYNQSWFKSPKTVQIFDRFATYNGSSPFKAPSMLSMISHVELNEGAFYPIGGMISIVKALYKLALKTGVEFVFNTKVDRIIHQQGQVQGIEVDGVIHDANLVVSNMDIYYLYRDLLSENKRAEDLLKQERSSSALIFYWGIRKTFPQLGLHNIFFSRNYAEEFRHLFETRELYHDPTIYINISSKMDASHAPLGSENWFVMLNAPADRGQNWDLFRREARVAVIGKLSQVLGTDIGSLIDTELVMDPRGISAQSLSYGGSLYGNSSNSPWAAFLRHPNFSSYIKGLYFTGGTVHPGGGIPLCLKSAGIVANLIGKP